MKIYIGKRLDGDLVMGFDIDAWKQVKHKPLFGGEFLEYQFKDSTSIYLTGTEDGEIDLKVFKEIDKDLKPGDVRKYELFDMNKARPVEEQKTININIDAFDKFDLKELEKTLHKAFDNIKKQKQKPQRYVKEITTTTKTIIYKDN